MTPGEIFRLTQLIPEARERVQRLLDAMEARGLPVYVGQTLRTQVQQADAQARGTTSANQVHSWHQLGRAADLRKRLPDDTGDPTTHDESFFRALYDEATALGLRSLAYHPDGSKVILHTTHGPEWDPGHVEFHGEWATLAEAFAAEGQKVA